MKPNIVIVMTDQQRADLRKAEGYPLDTMPFLDSWAAGGVDFRRAYTPNPTCMPARVSMFTGRYAECHKARTNHNMVDALFTEDLLDVLKREGYATALCGKNHSHRRPEDFDFHETNGHLGNESGLSAESPAHAAFMKFLDETKHMECHVPSPGGVEVQHPYRNVSAAFKFIDGLKKGTAGSWSAAEGDGEKPFFLWLSFAEPHNPYQVPEPYFDMFPPESLPPLATSAADLKAKGERFQWLRRTWEAVLGPDIEARIQRARSNYHGMLRLIDDQFKRFIQGLEERGLADNTLVVFLADHGDYVGEYGLIRKGGDLPEVLTRIPMAWRGPGVAAQGARADACVNLVDILPTLCDTLDVPVPFGSQGKSLAPLLRGKKVPKGEFDVGYSENGFSGLYWTDKDGLDLEAEGASHKMVTFDCLNTWTQCGQVRMVRKGDYKLQLDMQGTGYLYDLAADPREARNLWTDPAYASVKADLLVELNVAVLRAMDPLPAPHRRYRTKQHPQGYWRQDYVSADCGVRDFPPLADLRRKPQPR